MFEREIQKNEKIKSVTKTKRHLVTQIETDRQAQTDRYRHRQTKRQTDRHRPTQRQRENLDFLSCLKESEEIKSVERDRKTDR